MMSDNIARNMLSSQGNNGIINCPTQLHLVGHFYKICIMMHGSMNVKKKCVIAISYDCKSNS